MKIASYNILSGGFNSYGYESSLPERLELLKKAIGIINADFIGLIDTFRWDALYSISQLSELFGYKKAYCINLNDIRLKEKGHNNGITVLTNLPVDQFKTITLETRDAIKTTLQINNNELDIFTVYLDDLSEDVRVKQTRTLLKYVDQTKPTIIMGDLNTISLGDIKKLTPLIDKFAANNRQLYESMKSVLNEMKRGEVTKIFKENKLLDADKDGETTAPTRLFPAKIEGSVLRIDYAFHTNKIHVSDFKVLKDLIFDKTSDHYPIVFNIDIKE